MVLRTMFAARGIAQAIGAVVESMESRRLLSTVVLHAGGRLEITGSDVDNQIHITQSGKLINVEIDGVVQSFAAKKVDRLMIHALGGNDTIINDTDLPAKLEGGTGDDRLVGGTDRDRFIGGDGTDTADYSARTTALSLTLDGRRNDGQTNGKKNERDKLDDDIEILIGGSGNDRLVGNGLNNTLLGNAGDDTMIAGLGNDLLNGAAGNDLYDYSARTEAITGRFDSKVGASGRITIGTESDTIGDDLECRFFSGSGNDDIAVGTSQTSGQVRHYLEINGGGGNDKLTASGFEAINEVTLHGGDGDDTFQSGTDSSSTVLMFGDAGNDFCNRPGPWTFSGGDGDDTRSYWADYYSDIDLRTMDGVENLIIRSGTEAKNVYGTDGPNHIELLRGAVVQQIFGLGGDDVLIGGNSRDTIDGGEGNDTITGGGWFDVLIGGPGDDVFFNFDPFANVALNFPSMSDTIDGGDGIDTAQMDSLDVLTNVENVV